MPPRKINLPLKNGIEIEALSAYSAPEKNPGHDPRVFSRGILLFGFLGNFFNRFFAKRFSAYPSFDPPLPG